MLFLVVKVHTAKFVLFSITILTCKVFECSMLFPLPTMPVHTMPLLVMLQDVAASGVLA